MFLSHTLDLFAIYGIVPIQVSHIDVTKQSPCAWGRVICFSMYGGPQVDLRADPSVGELQNMLWVDTMLSDEVSARSLALFPNILERISD